MSSPTRSIDRDDSLRRDLLRATTQLSAMKDEAEELERKCIRLESQRKSLQCEVDGAEDTIRQLKREVDDLRRDNRGLGASKTELQSTVDALQRDLEHTMSAVNKLESEIAMRNQERTAAMAVQDNLQKQLDAAASHNALLQDQRARLEEELRGATNHLLNQQKIFEQWKQSTLREADHIASVMERSVMHAFQSSHQSGQIDDDLLSLASLVGGDSLSPRSSSTPLLSLRNSERDFGTNQSYSASHTLPHVDVKPLFTTIYSTAKTLRQFLSSVREERRKADDAVASMTYTTGSVEKELQAAAAEARSLNQRVMQSELQLARVTSQLEVTRRQQEEDSAHYNELLRALGEVLKPAMLDGPAIESQCRLVVNERDQLRERSASQQELISSLKSDIINTRQNAEDRVAAVERESATRLAHDANVFQGRLAAADEQKRKVLQDAGAAKELHDALVASMQAELDMSQKKLGDAVASLEKLEPSHRQLSREVPRLQEQLANRDKELIQLHDEYDKFQRASKAEIASLRCQLGPYATHDAVADRSSISLDEKDNISSDSVVHGRVSPLLPSAAPVPSTQTASSFCSIFELLIITLRVLHGARRDIQDMAWQRRCLTRMLLEYERLFGPLSTQFVSSKSQRRVLRFRSAVVAVIAANRLRSFVRQRKFLVEGLASLRRGFGRVRLMPETSVVVTRGAVGRGHPSIAKNVDPNGQTISRVKELKQQDFILPSAEEAKDIPALIAILLEQVKVPVTPPQSAWSHVAPLLIQHLQSSLQRIYLNGRSHGGVSDGTSSRRSRNNQSGNNSMVSPHRGPSLVFPVQAAPSGNHSTLIANTPYAGGVGVPSALKGSRAATAAAISLSSPAAAADHSSFMSPSRSSYGGSAFYPAPASYSFSSPGATMPSMPPLHNGNEEFTSEVLNVIRALDNKVAGALRLHPSHRHSGGRSSK